MIRETIAKLVSRQNLTEAEAEAVMEAIMDGQATPAQIGAFLTALRMKGETIPEIVGFARAMRRKAIAVRPRCQDFVDTCGTGGDNTGTFNISTTAAFVVAGAGLPVAKHGNRSVSSQCGSADLLQALGVNLELTPEQVAASVDEVGIGFLFAPRLHPAMKHALGPRREMGIRTVFNILGPLTNPASAPAQLMGVYDASLTEPLAHVLQALGSRAAFVVHGAHGMDELSTTGLNRVTYFANGRFVTFTIDPCELGLAPARPEDLKGGPPEVNVAITQAVLSGQKGPWRDVVLLNAAAALTAGGRAADLREGLVMAAESIDTGAARRVMQNLIEFSNDMAAQRSNG